MRNSLFKMAQLLVREETLGSWRIGIREHDELDGRRMEGIYRVKVEVLDDGFFCIIDLMEFTDGQDALLVYKRIVKGIKTTGKYIRPDLDGMN